MQQDFLMKSPRSQSALLTKTLVEQPRGIAKTLMLLKNLNVETKNVDILARLGRDSSNNV